MKVKQGLTGLKILFNSWPWFSRTTEILNRCCLGRKSKIFKFYIFMKRGFDTIILIYTKNITALAGNRAQGLRIYVSVLWPQTEFSDCPSRVSVAQRSEVRAPIRRFMDLGFDSRLGKSDFSYIHTYIYILLLHHINIILYSISYYILHVIYRIYYYWLYMVLYIILHIIL